MHATIIYNYNKMQEYNASRIMHYKSFILIIFINLFIFYAYISY